MPPDRGAGRGAAAARDAGLRRVSRLTRWLLAGALALTAAFSAIAAHAFPGHSGRAQASGTTQTTGTAQSSGTGSDDQSGQTDSGSSGSGLQAPSSSPFASGGSGSVTSGGS
jgi:hypothetical protein